MTTPAQFIAGGIVGAVASLIYFGGLWWTVRRLPTASNPSMVYLGSFLFRLAALMVGGYFLMQFGLPMFATAFVTFVVVRMMLTSVLGMKRRTAAAPNLELNHD